MIKWNVCEQQTLGSRWYGAHLTWTSDGTGFPYALTQLAQGVNKALCFRCVDTRSTWSKESNAPNTSVRTSLHRMSDKLKKHLVSAIRPWSYWFTVMQKRHKTQCNMSGTGKEPVRFFIFHNQNTRNHHHHHLQCCKTKSVLTAGPWNLWNVFFFFLIYILAISIKHTGERRNPDTDAAHSVALARRLPTGYWLGGKQDFCWDRTRKGRKWL